MALPQVTNTRFQNAEDVVSDIHRRIESGEWPEGHRLPPERELAALYGLAPHTGRGALKRMGPHPIPVIRRGTYVRAKKGGGVPGLGRHMKDASPAEVMEVRLIIEPQA